jgi:hypothetical protein
MQTLTSPLVKKQSKTAKIITERVTSFEDACEVLGINPKELILTADYPEAETDLKSANALIKLSIIVRALNEGWKPNWKDSSENKYYAWFDMSSGSGLSFFGCNGWYSSSAVGSRLCFKSRELAEYAGKQFIDIYTDLFII